MSARGIASLGVLVLAVGGGYGQEKSDRDNLQGEWTLASAVTGGRAWKEEDLKKVKVTVKGNVWIRMVGDQEVKTEFTLNATTTPKEINFLPRSKKSTDQLRCIYKLEGDTFTFCRPLDPKGNRPKEFKAGEGVILAVYKRAAKK